MQQLRNVAEIHSVLGKVLVGTLLLFPFCFLRQRLNYVALAGLELTEIPLPMPPEPWG